ncbi:MAG: PucR family transcriptional regulator, partial [Eubacteriales bacterium]
MISNQVLQNTIDGLKVIARVELCVVDAEGKAIASTNAELESYNCSMASLEFAKSPADSQEVQGFQYFKIFDEQQLEYILVASGAGEDVYMVGKMVAFQIQNLLVAYKERFDKDNFIKNLLLDNLLLVDIYSRAKKLHLQQDVNRVTMIIESKAGKDNKVLELMRANFGSNNKDFITAVDENNVIVVKELAYNDNNSDIENYALHFQDFLVKEGVLDV